MLFPATAAIVADTLGAKNAAAYDLLAGCTGFVYALSQAYGAVATGLSKRALVIGSEVLSRIIDWNDRSTCILFGDGAGAASSSRSGRAGSSGSSWERTARAGPTSAPGRRLADPGHARAVEDEMQFIRMNGAEVFRFATRVMVSSAEELLATCGATVDDVDLYVPHQANKRIIDHAAKKLGARPGQGAHEHRPLRQHVVGLDPDLPRRGPVGGAARGRDARADHRGRRGAHLGLGLSDLDDHGGD